MSCANHRLYRAYNHWQKTETDIASLTHILNDRLVALQRLEYNNRLGIQRHFVELSNILSDLYQMNALVPATMQRLASFSDALVHMSELRQALLDAISGRLNTFLVSDVHMDRTLRNIAVYLRDVHPLLRLVASSTAEAFQSSDFIVSRLGREVYIIVKFAVTPVRHIFTVYDVVRFPVVMPDATKHVTVLDSDVTHFVYAPQAYYHLKLRSEPKVRHHLLYMQDVSETFQHFSVPTCISALFHNAASDIKSLCSFLLHPHSLEPSVRMLDESTVLFTNVTNITRICTEQIDTLLPSCLQCIYKLPCTCYFHADSLYVPPHLSNCTDLPGNDSLSPLTHVTNLAVLDQFFGEEDLGNLAAHTLLDHPIAAVIPNLFL